MEPNNVTNPSDQVQQPVQPVQQVQPAAPVQDLPVDSRDKTKEQFEKLLESNRRLFEANEKLRKDLETRGTSNRMFEPIQQAPIQSNRPQVNPQDFVETDPVTGESFINEGRLRQKMDEIQQKASRAEEAIQSYIQTAEQREIERQNKEAYTTYPELNPTGQQFDNEFNKQVRGVLFDSMYNIDDYGGKPLSFKEAADFVRTQYSKVQGGSQAKADDAAAQAAAAQAADDLKQNAAAQAQSQPQQSRQTMADTEEMMALKQMTRHGDLDALTKRLMNIPHTRDDAQA